MLWFPPDLAWPGPTGIALPGGYRAGRPGVGWRNTAHLAQSTSIHRRRVTERLPTYWRHVSCEGNVGGRASRPLTANVVTC